MKKKLALGLAFWLVAAGALFAQEAEAEAPVTQAESTQKKMAVSLDLMPLFKGLVFIDTDNDTGAFAPSLSFEYLVRDHFSLRLTLDTWFGDLADDLPFFYFGLVPQGRWYFLSESLDKLYLGAGFGINLLSIDGEDPEPKYGGHTGLTVNLQAGYKLILGPGIFVEPSISYVYSKTDYSGVTITPLGWQTGLNFGFAF